MNVKTFLLILGLIFTHYCQPDSDCDIKYINTGSAFNDQPFVDYNSGTDIIDPMDGMSFYYGNLHSHTTSSHGTVTPAEAYTWARDTVGLDFYAITDHCRKITDELWNDIGVQAGIFSVDGEFLAIRGFEWSDDKDGHINIFNTTTYTNSALTDTLPKIIAWIDENGAYAQYNHPGKVECLFRRLSYYPEGADNIIAIETGNKNISNLSNDHLYIYPYALANGWRFAPTNNMDNHTLTANSHRTVIITDQLDMNGLLNALSNRRIYSSDDPDIRIIFKIGIHWMGSTVSIGPGMYKFLVIIEDNEPLAKLQLIDAFTRKSINQLTITGNTTSVIWEPEIELLTDRCFYIKVYESDTNNDEGNFSRQVAVTSAIWLKIK